MTTDEIRALCAELEYSLLVALLEFKTKTGLSVTNVDVRTTKHQMIGSERIHQDVTGLSVVLESL